MGNCLDHHHLNIRRHRHLRNHCCLRRRQSPFPQLRCHRYLRPPLLICLFYLLARRHRCRHRQN